MISVLLLLKCFSFSFLLIFCICPALPWALLKLFFYSVSHEQEEDGLEDREKKAPRKGGGRPYYILSGAPDDIGYLADYKSNQLYSIQ